MKKLLATAILMSATSAFAHDTNFSTDSCDIELNAGLRINSSIVEFSKNDKPLYQILNDKFLIVNGEAVSLNAEQQALISNYSTSIRAVIPEVKDIAVDAIELAVQGVNLAFNELLGDSNKVGSELTAHLYDIRDEIDNRFASGKEFYIDENGELSDDFLGKEFEQRIESVIEETVQNSLGSLLIAVGQEMLFSGGDMGAFEARMETFGEKIEQEMETRGEELEKRGEALCFSVYKIDGLEEQLKAEINELSNFDVITADKSDKHKM